MELKKDREGNRMITQLEKLYADYAEEAYNVRKKARVFDGILGLGKDPRNHPCHQAYYDAVGAWAAEFVASAPEQEQLMAAAMFIVEAPAARVGEECYWFMFAAHGHLKPLIPYLSKENCAKLGARLEELYKKRDRMPLQKELLKLLAKGAK